MQQTITHLFFWSKHDSGHKYYAPQVRPDRGSKSWPPDHDSTFHVTKPPAPTTWPSVTVTYLQLLRKWYSQIIIGTYHVTDEFGQELTPSKGYLSDHAAPIAHLMISMVVARGDDLELDAFTVN